MEKSTDKRRRRPTQSSAHSTSMSLPDCNVEREQSSRPQSCRQSGDQTLSTGSPDMDILGGGSQIQTSSTSPDTPVNFSWALSPLPEAPDLFWELHSDDFLHMMDVDQNSSTDDSVPRTPAFSSCASITHKSLPQSLDVEIEVDNDKADASYNLNSIHPDSQYLQQSGQCLVSSFSTAVPRMRNPSRSSSNMSKQCKKSFPSEVSGTPTLGPRRGSHPRDSIINSPSMMDLPVPPGKHSRPTSGPTHLHASRMPSSPVNAFAAPSITSVASTPGLPSFSSNTSPRSDELPQSSDSGRGCQCVTVMLKILENMGVQGLGTDTQDTDAGLDLILSSLARGMNLTEQVLACAQCNACTENGMLLATIAQQLGTMAATATTCLPSQELSYESNKCTQWRRDCRFSRQGPRSETAGSVLDLSNSDDPARSTSDLLEGTVCLGRYKVHSPEIRSQLIYHALLLHISQLWEILVRIKDRVRSNRGAWKLLVNTGVEVGKLRDIFDSKVSHQQ